jgi:hypothetical protein
MEEMMDRMREIGMYNFLREYRYQNDGACWRKLLHGLGKIIVCPSIQTQLYLNILLAADISLKTSDIHQPKISSFYPIQSYPSFEFYVNAPNFLSTIP